jgi:hypothetical protein
VHLLGPYALPVQQRLPPVPVTADVSSLFERRAALYGRLPSLKSREQVFTPDALLLDDQINQGWVSEKEEFARLFGLFQHWPPMRQVPTASR